jgi:Protein phosphatase 2C
MLRAMALRILDRVWDPDSAANADWCSNTLEAVLLLDGAAPMAPERVSSYPNDTVWLVRRFPEHFREQLARAARAPGATGVVDIAAIAEGARQALAHEYHSLCEQASARPAERPFACLAIAHDTGAAGGTIELLNLGDQTTLVFGREGLLGKLGEESAVRELDRQAIELLERARAEGIEPHAARHAHLRPTLLANRALRNQLPGYDVLDVDIDCRERFERLSLPRADIRGILMMSDGFYRLVDTFGQHTDLSLLEAVERAGLAPLLAELRAIEIEDPECIRYPRFKRHDDTTALWIDVDRATS